MYNDYFNQEWQITVIRLKSIFWAIHKLFWLRVIVCQKILTKIHNDNYWLMNDTISRMFLHVGDSAAVDRDWTVVILGFCWWHICCWRIFYWIHSNCWRNFCWWHSCYWCLTWWWCCCRSHRGSGSRGLFW